MAEQTFKSPGFFEREIDLSETTSEVTGVPAGIIGTSEMGPAFLPVTIGSFADFEARFGGLHPDRFGPYAVHAFLENMSAATYIRVLGAGSNSDTTDFNNTIAAGIVKNAGYIIKGTAASNFVTGAHAGCVQFLVARHKPTAHADLSVPMFTDNDSYGIGPSGNGTDTVHLVRGMIFTATGTRAAILDGNQYWNTDPTIGGFLTGTEGPSDNLAKLHDSSTSVSNKADPMYKSFKIAFRSNVNGAAEQKFNDENITGLRILTASLDPNSENYISKVLNTDPLRFQEEHHLLHTHFPVHDEIAPVDTSNFSIVLASGSHATTNASGLTTTPYRDLFGRFDTRYRTPRTSFFISQPFAGKEFDLFFFETISDGAIANTKFKISIGNIKKSSDPKNPYGTFSVYVRDFGDTDTAPMILEQYSNCNLDPQSPDYIAAKIGDMKLKYNFDAEQESERRHITFGRYANQSRRIRVRMSVPLERGLVPSNALPFGFRGIPTIKTNDTFTDKTDVILRDPDGNTVGHIGGTRIISHGGLIGTGSAVARWHTDGGGDYGDGVPEDGKKMPGFNSSTARLTFRAYRSGSADPDFSTDRFDNIATLHTGTVAAMSGAIVPPLPFRFKLTKNSIGLTSGDPSQGAFVGQPGSNEIVNGSYYWGVQFERVPVSSSAGGSIDNSVLRPNESGRPNEIIANFAKFTGIKELDVLVTGTAKDHFNNNKFTLARVAFSNHLEGSTAVASKVAAVITGTVKEHMLEAAYIRNGKPHPTTVAVADGYRTDRITLGTLMSLTSSTYFNKFSDYAKFTSMFYGGFDGLNSLDRDMVQMNDRSTSQDTGGKGSLVSPAADTILDIGLSGDMTIGRAHKNNVAASYRTAIRIITDPMVSRINILAVPGVRDASVTSYAAERVKAYKKAIYLMDIPSYDDDKLHVFDKSSLVPSVDKTVDKFDGRGVDNNYAAAYFPDVTIQDPENGSAVQVPASVAALSALGYNDKNYYPWFAPAGFNRGSLTNVLNTKTRLNSEDRNELYEARINPIATFPNAGFVIFGQKTLQRSRSALDRVNVRRMLLEVKRIVSDVALTFVFEANTPEVRSKFVAQITPLLATVQSQQGIERFSVTMDGTNNTTDDIESNKLNGSIVLVPTRAVEFIAIDFIITNSGVEF